MNPSAAERRTRWLRVALLAGTLILLCMLAELTARLHPLYIVMTAPPRPTTADGAPLAVLRTPLQLATPGTEGLYKGHHYRANSLGFRGEDHSPGAEPGTLRILVTGDSVAMGDGVDEAATYSSHLTSLLSDHARVEVINVAISGANIDAAMNRLEKGIEAYAPSAVVYGFTINDIEGPAYRDAAEEVKRAWRVQRRGPFADSRSAALRVLSPHVAALSNRRSPRENWYAVELFGNYEHNPEAWRAIVAGFDRFAQILESRGICGHVFIHTHLNALGDDHAYTDIYERVANEARIRGIPVTVSWPDFAGRDGRALWVSPFDPHPNAQAHRILAESLARGLKSAPSSCL